MTKRSAKLDPRIVAGVASAIVAGLFSLGAIYFGYWLGTRQVHIESREATIRADQYPFADTGLNIDEGDEVEIRVLDANSHVWNCGWGRTNAMGFAEWDFESLTILPTANACALVGQIEGGPVFVVGAYYTFEAKVSGSLFLGANDWLPQECEAYGCFEDNDGELFVKITVKRE
jgi:hypothetical protein